MVSQLIKGHSPDGRALRAVKAVRGREQNVVVVGEVVVEGAGGEEGVGADGEGAFEFAGSGGTAGMRLCQVTYTWGFETE